MVYVIIGGEEFRFACQNFIYVIFSMIHLIIAVMAEDKGVFAEIFRIKNRLSNGIENRVSHGFNSTLTDSSINNKKRAKLLGKNCFC